MKILLPCYHFGKKRSGSVVAALRPRAGWTFRSPHSWQMVVFGFQGTISWRQPSINSHFSLLCTFQDWHSNEALRSTKWSKGKLWTLTSTYFNFTVGDLLVPCIHIHDNMCLCAYSFYKFMVVCLCAETGLQTESRESLESLAKFTVVLIFLVWLSLAVSPLEFGTCSKKFRNVSLKISQTFMILIFVTGICNSENYRCILTPSQTDRKHV